MSSQSLNSATVIVKYIKNKIYLKRMQLQNFDFQIDGINILRKKGSIYKECLTNSVLKKDFIFNLYITKKTLTSKMCV